MSAVTVTLAISLAVVATLALPHLVDLAAAPPRTAATVWLAVLALRALVVVGTALFALLVLPTTQLFTAATHWCWDAVVPLMSARLGLEGHRIGGAVAIVPGVLLAGSVAIAAAGLRDAARSVRRLLVDAPRFAPEDDVLVVRDPDIFLAAAGVRRPRVVVSSGALLRLDDDELAASLDHERGHIAHRHHVWLIAAELCRAVAAALPGTTTARAHLRFHLEREADRYALACRHRPATLASAICKAATAGAGRASTVQPSLGSADVVRRVEQLLQPSSATPAATRCARPLAVAIASVTLTAAVALPQAAVAAVAAAPHDQQQHCA